MTDAPDFRAVGFTDAAAQYPKDELAKIALAAWLNVPVEKLPVAMHYHPNSSMMEAWGRVGAAIATFSRRAQAPEHGSSPSAERQLAEDILVELVRARTKFPGKNVTFAALVEEVGELATATFEESAERVRKEAVQVAVMAMRMVLDGDHTYEPWRAEKGLDPLDPAKRATPVSVQEFPPSSCNAREDCQHDGICHDPKTCGAKGPNHDVWYGVDDAD